MPQTRVFPFFLAACLLFLCASPARAGRDDRLPPVRDPATRAVCGQCHMAFQPGFLPARSWEALMGSLESHFGVDASLPPPQREAVTRYLVENAADRSGDTLARAFLKRIDRRSTPLRLTGNPAFIHEHRKTSWQDLRNSAIGSITNCRACHRKAEKGRYDD